MDSRPLDHIAIYVPDLADAEKVMNELLGYEKEQALEARPISLRVWREQDHGFHFVLCQVTYHEASDRADPTYSWAEQVAPAVHHLAHRVPALEPALLESGLEKLTPIATDEGMRQAFVRVGNDGVVHEFIERLAAGAQFSRGNITQLLKGKSEVPAVAQHLRTRRK